MLNKNPKERITIDDALKHPAMLRNGGGARAYSSRYENLIIENIKKGDSNEFKN